MTPFEQLIKELGTIMSLNLKPDNHESCKLVFSDDLAVQLDLTPNADAILIGSELGSLAPGPYKDRIIRQALKVNGMLKSPRGILSFSEKKDALVLFQFLEIAHLNATTLHKFLELFLAHARVWKESLRLTEIPQIEEEKAAPKDAMFGLR